MRDSREDAGALPAAVGGELARSGGAAFIQREEALSGDGAENSFEIENGQSRRRGAR